MPPPKTSSDDLSSAHQSGASSPPTHSKTIIASPESDAGFISRVSNAQEKDRQHAVEEVLPFGQWA